MKLLIVIPAFNEAKVIVKVLKSLKQELKKINIKNEIVVVDDGSCDRTSELARQEIKIVLKHPINRGLGGALGTGFEYARRNKFDIIVTFDADDQHNAKDIKELIKPIVHKQADVVIGSRTLKGNAKIPPDRRIIIQVSNFITLLLYGVKTTDSQSGLRAFSKNVLNKIKIKTQGMEVSTEIFSEIKRHNLKLAEIPISVIYTEYSRSKGQSNLNAISIIARLLLRLSR